MAEKTPMKHMCIRVPMKIYEEITELAERDERSVNFFMNKKLPEWVAKEKAESEQQRAA